MSEKLRAHLLLLAVVAIWGSTFVLVKDALNDISPLLFNLIRMALATLCLAAVYRKQLRRLTREALLGGAVAGFFLAVGYQFQTAGLALTTPSKSFLCSPSFPRFAFPARCGRAGTPTLGPSSRCSESP
jgi:drug/metabolite transporter (DMT)-like permease